MQFQWVELFADWENLGNIFQSLKNNQSIKSIRCHQLIKSKIRLDLMENVTNLSKLGEIYDVKLEAMLQYIEKCLERIKSSICNV